MRGVPFRTGLRAVLVAPPDPYVGVTVPAVVAGDPDVLGARSRRHDLDDGRGGGGGSPWTTISAAPPPTCPSTTTEGGGGTTTPPLACTAHPTLNAEPNKMPTVMPDVFFMIFSVSLTSDR